MADLRSWMLLTFVWITSPMLNAHPFHASLCEIEWNAGSQRFEVAMKLRIVDLEDAITAQQGTKFRIEHSPNVKQSFQKYLQQHFAVTFEGHPASRLHWVGLELELHDAWIYFEAESMPGQAQHIPLTSVPPADGTKRKLSWDDLVAAAADRKPAVAEIRTPSAAVRIRNSLLTDVQSEQINLVEFTFARREQLATLNRKTPETRFSLE